MPTRFCSVLLFVLGACERPSESSKPEAEPADTAAADDTATSGDTGEEDALLAALDCPGSATPMQLETLHDAYRGSAPLYNVVLSSYLDQSALGLAVWLAEDLGLDCASYSADETSGSTSASSSCERTDGLLLQGQIEVTEGGDLYESVWTDLVMDDGNLTLSGDGTLRQEQLDADGAQISVTVDRRWTASGDDDVEGSFAMQAEGVMGVAGETLTGWVDASGSPEVNDGEICVAWTCDDKYIRVGGRSAEDALEDPSCRLLFQGDRLWEERFARQDDGGICSTVSVDGEVVEDDCG